MWRPVGAATLGIALACVADLLRYDATAVATHVTAHHSAGLRVALLVLSVCALLGVTMKRQRLATVWVVAAVTLVLNVCATSRVAMGSQTHPHVAVAGIEVGTVQLREDVGYYEGLLCFTTFSRTERTMTVDGRTLKAPFLPLPVDWSEVDGFVTEMTCTAAAGGR